MFAPNRKLEPVGVFAQLSNQHPQHCTAKHAIILHHHYFDISVPKPRHLGIEEMRKRVPFTYEAVLW